MVLTVTYSVSFVAEELILLFVLWLPKVDCLKKEQSHKEMIEACRNKVESKKKKLNLFFNSLISSTLMFSVKNEDIGNRRSKGPIRIQIEKINQ